MIYSFLFLALGFFVSVLFTPWVIRLGQTGIGLDHANEPRKKHESQFARLQRGLDSARQ